MTDLDQKLDSSLVWDREHLGETALQALADGELDLLPEAAVRHVSACHHCDQRLAFVALQAVDVATVLAASLAGSTLVPVPVPARSRRPFPLAAFAAALAVAATGLIVQLNGVLGGLTRLPSLVTHATPVLMRGLKIAFGGATGSPGLASWVAAALLVLGGVLIARLAPVHSDLKGPA